MSDKQITPEQALILRIVEQWGNVVNMPKMEQWLKDYAASQPPAVKGAVWVKGEYVRLYNQLKADPVKKTPCFVDYDGFSKNSGGPPCRDICYVNGTHLEFRARGIGYGGAEPWLDEEDKKEAFLKDCERLNVEWLDESPTAAGDGKEVKYDDLYRLVYSNLARLRARTQHVDRLVTFHSEIRAIIEEVTEEMQGMPQPDNSGDKPYIVQSEDGKDAIQGKAWDDWRDSLIKRDGCLVHQKERTEKYSEPFTFEEFKALMLEKSPVFLYNTMYSEKEPLYQITSQFMPSGVEFFATSWADKKPIKETLEKFYKRLKTEGLQYVRF